MVTGRRRLCCYKNKVGEGEGVVRRMHKSKRGWAVFFIGPAVLFLLVFSVVPMAYSLGLSFLHYNTAMAADTVRFVGLENYLSVLTDKGFWDSALWTFLFAVSAVGLNVLIGLTLAVALNTKLLPRLSKGLKIVFIMPMMIAPIVTATIWKLMFSPIYGVLNGILVSLGLDRVNWFADVLPARIAIIVVEVWATTPLCMLILMAALQTVPEEMLEAARIDGAAWWEQFKQIVLPLIKKFILLVVTLRFMDAIRMFDIVYNLTNGGPGTATETLASTIYKTAFRYFNVGEGSAGAYIFFLIIIGFSFLLMKLAGKGEE